MDEMGKVKVANGEHKRGWRKPKHGGKPARLVSRPNWRESSDMLKANELVIKRKVSHN